MQQNLLMHSVLSRREQLIPMKLDHFKDPDCLQQAFLWLLLKNTTIQPLMQVELVSQMSISSLNLQGNSWNPKMVDLLIQMDWVFIQVQSIHMLIIKKINMRCKLHGLEKLLLNLNWFWLRGLRKSFRIEVEED